MSFLQVEANSGGCTLLFFFIVGGADPMNTTPMFVTNYRLLYFNTINSWLKIWKSSSLEAVNEFQSDNICSNKCPRCSTKSLRVRFFFFLQGSTPKPHKYIHLILLADGYGYITDYLIAYNFKLIGGWLQQHGQLLECVLDQPFTSFCHHSVHTTFNVLVKIITRYITAVFLTNGLCVVYHSLTQCFTLVYQGWGQKSWVFLPPSNHT